MEVTYNNETKELKVWCEELGIPYSIARYRIVSLGWDFERVVNYEK